VKNRSNNSHFYQSVHNTIYKKKTVECILWPFCTCPKKWSWIYEANWINQALCTPFCVSRCEN